MKIWGIRNQLILAFFVFSLVLLGSLGFYLYEKEKESSLHQLGNSLYTEGSLYRNALFTPDSDPRSLQERLKELTGASPYRVTIIDGSGKVIADSQESPESMDNHSNREEVRATLEGKRKSLLRYSDTLKQTMLYTAVPISPTNLQKGVIRIASPLTPITALFEAQKNILITGLLFSCLIAILFALFLARRFTAPIEELTQIAEKMNQGDLTARSQIRRKDEIGILAHTFNQLGTSLGTQLENLSVEKKKSRLILEQMEDPVFLLSTEGIIQDVNEAGIRYFENPLEKHFLQLIHRTELVTAFQEANRKNATVTFSFELPFSGERKIFQAFISPLKEGNNTNFLLVLHDITTLQALYQRQGEFVANASHELATPLAIIQGYSETLLDTDNLAPEKQKDFLNLIHSESLRMKRLLGDLKKLARLESDDAITLIAKQPLNFTELCQDEIPLFLELAKDKNIAFTQELQLTLPDIQGNLDWLRQCVDNLLTNAIKFTPEKGSIHLALTQENNFLHLAITDTGVGIPTEDLEKIFQRFYRVDSSRQRNEGGTGLGLAIVKHIVTLHQGEVWAESQLGKGSTFHVRLPLSTKI